VPLQTTQDAGGPRRLRGVSDTIEAAAIVCFTATGSTVWRVSRNRPHAIVAAFTPSERVRNQLTLAWGVVPRLTEDPANTDDMVRIANASVRDSGLAEVGERIVMTAGVPFGMHGTTNLIGSSGLL
jgi:pyruvate kinase